MGSEEEEESYSSNDENSDSGENLAEAQVRLPYHLTHSLWVPPPRKAIIDGRWMGG